MGASNRARPEGPLLSSSGRVCGISHRFNQLSPTEWHFPGITHLSATAGKDSKLSPLPFDLHVLGLPPAFNLSHDQTLQFNHC